jgi:uncharacterized damage-inducible protein DinB
MAFIGRVVKRVLIAPRVRKLTWEQLCSAAAASRERFEALIADETEESASVSARGAMSVKNTLAHLATANRAIADRLEALRAGKQMEGKPPDLFPPSEGKSLGDLRKEFAESWRILADSAARKVTNRALTSHHFFGPMSAAEWVALIAVHHEYHIRRVDRVKQSEEYRKVRGARW